MTFAKRRFDAYKYCVHPWVSNHLSLCPSRLKMANYLSIQYWRGCGPECSTVKFQQRNYRIGAVYGEKKEKLRSSSMRAFHYWCRKALIDASCMVGEKPISQTSPTLKARLFAPVAQHSYLRSQIQIKISSVLRDGPCRNRIWGLQHLHLIPGKPGRTSKLLLLCPASAVCSSHATRRFPTYFLSNISFHLPLTQSWRKATALYVLSPFSCCFAVDG